MAHAATGTQPQLKSFVLPSSLRNLCFGLVLLGVVTFVVGLALHNDRIWSSYLVSFFYFTSLALGGLFFVAIQHVSKAGWSVGIRRIPEAMSSFLWLALPLALVLLLGGSSLYVWLNPKVVAADPVLHAKAAYLNWGFWSLRFVVFFAVWLTFQNWMVGSSVRQDESGDHHITLRNLNFSVAFLLVFAVSYSLFSVDTLMSLQPHWSSTIFGVYCFAGLFQSALAMMAIILVWLLNRQDLKGFVSDHHLHDVGKYLFAFTIFYAYIAFSQFMLIWYANLPEETEFYWNRMFGGWLWISIAIALFKFVVPFLALLPKWAKRNHAHIVAVSILILIMQYVDIYWVVYPNFNDNNVVFSLWEVFIFLGFAGAFVLMLTRFMASNKLVPIKDPRLSESIHHEVVY